MPVATIEALSQKSAEAYGKMFKSFPKSLPTLRSLPQAIGLPFLSSQEDAQLRFRSEENGIKRLYGDEVCFGMTLTLFALDRGCRMWSGGTEPKGK